MNKITGLFCGIFFLFGLSWLGLVAFPYLTFAALRQSKDDATGALAPLGNPGAAAQGARVYAANGCFYCHSQYVREKDEGNDIDRKWGTRRTVARDYMYDQQVFLGTTRLGADLSNVGVRQTDPQWFYRILYSPRTMSHQVSIVGGGSFVAAAQPPPDTTLAWKEQRENVSPGAGFSRRSQGWAVCPARVHAAGPPGNCGPPVCQGPERG